MRKTFGQVLMDIALYDEKIVLLTGDVEQEMQSFKDTFPSRFFNVGICEQSMVSMAAGLALTGLCPIVYSITPFLLERAFEQIKLDIDENNLPVILIGYDHYPTLGVSHRTLGNVQLCSMFKNIVSYHPQDLKEARNDILSAYFIAAPSIICLKKA